MLGALIVAERPLTAQSYHELPRFGWGPPRRQPIAAFLYLLVLIAVIGGIAMRRFRRAQLI